MSRNLALQPARTGSISGVSQTRPYAFPHARERNIQSTDALPRDSPVFQVARIKHISAENVFNLAGDLGFSISVGYFSSGDTLPKY